MPIRCGDGTGMHPELRSRRSILLTPEKSNEGEQARNQSARMNPGMSAGENKSVIAGTFKG